MHKKDYMKLLEKYKKSSPKRYEVIHQMLNDRKIYNSKFDSVGESIKVGCWQMAAKKLEKIRKEEN